MSSLSPVDLLSLSAGEQIILRCLTRHAQLTLPDLARETGKVPEEVERLLRRLLDDARIVEQLRQGKRIFSARFQFRQAAVRNMPDAVRNLFRQASDDFLAEVALTASLSSDTAAELLALSQTRRLLPDEVLAWQGARMAFVAVVHDGILVQSRLQGRSLLQKSGYVQRKEWVGLEETFNESPPAYTYTAVTNTTLLTWPAEAFLAFAQRHPHFSLQVGRYLGQALEACRRQRTQGQGKLWAVEAVHAGAGATTVAHNLALLARQADAAQPAKVLLWHGAGTEAPPTSEQRRVVAGMGKLFRGDDGLDHFFHSTGHEYPPQVQLDILLSHLLLRYDAILCDTGTGAGDDLALRLRGRADALLTVTREAGGAEAGVDRWRQSQPYAAPGQKRVLVLNGHASRGINVDARFNIVLPEDVAAEGADWSVLQQPDGALSQALVEVFQRLSLNHALAIFVPSTVEVDRQTDNSAQVQSALSFFGDVFGGATSSGAEGVWRSEESGLVSEQVTIVRAFVSKQALDTHLDDVVQFASLLKEEMKQEAVAISVDNQLILV